MVLAIILTLVGLLFFFATACGIKKFNVVIIARKPVKKKAWKYERLAIKQNPNLFRSFGKFEYFLVRFNNRGGKWKRHSF